MVPFVQCAADVQWCIFPKLNLQKSDAREDA